MIHLQYSSLGSTCNYSLQLCTENVYSNSNTAIRTVLNCPESWQNKESGHINIKMELPWENGKKLGSQIIFALVIPAT